MNKPTLIQRYADNGEHSHWELIDTPTGKTIWTESGESPTAPVTEAENATELSEELWDKYSQYIGKDIDELDQVAGSSVITERQYKKLIAELLAGSAWQAGEQEGQGFVWTDNKVLEFAKLYRFASSRCSIDQYKRDFTIL